MEYKRFGDTLVLRLDPPEEICESITAAARAENIALAEISGIGAADSFTVGVYNTVTKEYRSNTLNGAYEIVSLTGTLTSKDGEPYLHLHFSAGDENGRVGCGSGKANEVPEAIDKATAQAKKAMRKVAMVGTTIPHVVIGKFGRGSVLMMPAEEGTGVIAGGPVRAVMEAAGIKNIRTKSHGSSNPVNMVKAVITGLNELRTAEQVAALRGKTAEEIMA